MKKINENQKTHASNDMKLLSNSAFSEDTANWGDFA